MGRLNGNLKRPPGFFHLRLLIRMERSISVLLTDIFMQLKYKIHRSHSIETHYHYFALGSKVYEDALLSDNTINVYLGSEIDVVYKWKIIKALDLEFGLSGMLPGESLELIQNVSKSEFTYYGYIMLRVNQDIVFNNN